MMMSTVSRTRDYQYFTKVGRIPENRGAGLSWSFRDLLIIYDDKFTGKRPGEIPGLNCHKQTISSVLKDASE
jgi:hypothetical protein